MVDLLADKADLEYPFVCSTRHSSGSYQSEKICSLWVPHSLLTDEQMTLRIVWCWNLRKMFANGIFHNITTSWQMIKLGFITMMFPPKQKQGMGVWRWIDPRYGQKITARKGKNDRRVFHSQRSFEAGSVGDAIDSHWHEIHWTVPTLRSAGIKKSASKVAA